MTLDDPRFGSPTGDWLENPAVGPTVRATVVRGLRELWPANPALRDRLLERL